MALDATTLGNTLKVTLEDEIRASLTLPTVPYEKLSKFCEGLGKAIARDVIDHFKANAELDNAKFSGTFSGTVAVSTCSTTITDQPVTGGIK